MAAVTPLTDYGALSEDPIEAGVVLDGIQLPPITVVDPGPPVLTLECSEPLVVVNDRLMCVNAYHRGGWPGTSAEVWLRAGVVDRLETAQAGLPPGFGLAIFDGWRSPKTIRALYSHYYGPTSTLAPGFLADPDDSTRIPPHLTGGAVDLTLTWRGVPLSLGTPFDEFSARANLRAFETEGEHRLISQLRRLLIHHLSSEGFAPYLEEWWHVSFGDEAWARTHRQPHAIYGVTAPPAP